MSKGRPRKPDKIKKLEGTYRNDRDRSDEVPKFPVIIDAGEAPEYFTPQQKSEFKFITGELIRINLLESVDMNLIVAYCVVAAQFHDASKKLNQNYTMYNAGKIIISPYFKIQQDSLKSMMAIGSKLGFSPVDRQKLKSQKKPEVNKDPLMGEI